MKQPKKRQAPLTKAEIGIVKMRKRIMCFILFSHDWPTIAIAARLSVSHSRVKAFIAAKCPLLD